MPDPLVADNLAMIEQGRRLIESLDPEIFVTKSSASLGASIGGHLRHNLDHYACFLQGIETARIDYDDRARAGTVETDPAAANRALALAAQRLGDVNDDALDQDVLVRMDTGDSEDRPWTRSSGRRELQFLLSHTVHHYALIAMICRQHNQPVAKDFGVAPSTLKYRQRSGQACAR